MSRLVNQDGLTVLRGTSGADVEAVIGDSPGALDPVDGVVLFRGDDVLSVTDSIQFVRTNRGDDVVTIDGDAGVVRLGAGDDVLTLSGSAGLIHGGRGQDTLDLGRAIGDFDVRLDGLKVVLIDRLTGEETTVRAVETFVFEGETLSLDEMRARFGDGVPDIAVAGGTQVLTVADADPTPSVVWDRVAQLAVIETESFVGPTIASRAYAMMHTAMYDAWSAYDPTAVRVSFDEGGDNAALEAGLLSNDANKTKAMSFAAFTVLNALFPDQAPLFETVMTERFGFSLTDDGSPEAAVGIDAAEDLLALRGDDGSNQTGGYQGDFTPTNPSPLEINDITAWTPENVPIDPEDANPEQSFLTPQWENVESFAIAEDADGNTVFDDIRPFDPKPFFLPGFEDGQIDFGAKTFTFGQDVTIDGNAIAAGTPVPIDQSLIGEVVNPGFIQQAEDVIAASRDLTDREKIIAEFWEDGGGTAFPPGTFMSFAHFVSARDGNSIDDDAALFLAMGNAVMDAGIATWEAKVFHDYVRPVRAIRDLGELGLIGEEGVDEVTGEEGFVIESFGGIDAETGEGLGTRTILAENFESFQRFTGDPSPPFAEYTSGHSAFSAAGAEVLRLFTGDDAFGGSVTFQPGSTQFEQGVPEVETTLGWATFTEAADEAGLSRIFGGIHFEDGDVNGRQLGRDVGADAFALAQRFVDGSAVDEDRPFFEGGLLA